MTSTKLTVLPILESCEKPYLFFNPNHNCCCNVYCKGLKINKKNWLFRKFNLVLEQIIQIEMAYLALL